MSDDSPQFVPIDEWVTSRGNTTPFQEPQPEEGDPTWGDYGRAVLSGAQTLGAQANDLGRYISELAGRTDDAEYFRARGQLSRMDVADTVGGMSETGRKRLEASMLSGEFWSHPGSAPFLKLANMTPSLAASLVPVGLASNALIGVMGVSAGLGAGAALEEFYRQIDEISDADLQAQSDVYRGLRTMMDEPEARRQFDVQMQGFKPALNAIVGAAAGAAGPVGAIARGGVTGASTRLGAMGLGAAEAAAGEGAQEAMIDATTQSALIEGGLRKEFDSSQVAQAALEGVVAGGLLGGAVGVAVGGHGRGRVRAPQDVNQAPKVQPGTGEQAKPPVADIGNPESAPVRSERVYDKTVPESAQPTITEVDVVAPDQAAAIAAKQSIPPEVAEAAQRLQDPAADEVPAVQPRPDDVAPPVDVPPEVAQASQRLQQPAGEAKPGESIASDINPEVTQQVTPKADVEVPRAPQVKTGRILKAEDADWATPEMEQRAHQQELNRQEALAKDKGRNRKGAAVNAKVAEMAENARKIFDSVPELKKVPVSKMERADLHERLEAILDAAKQLKIAIPQKISDATPDHVMWLREVADLARKFGTKNGPSIDHMTDFVLREKAARGGDFSIMRGERKAAGEAKARAHQGDVETKAGAILTPDGAEHVEATHADAGEVAQAADIADTTKTGDASAVDKSGGESIPEHFRAEQQDRAAAATEHGRRVDISDHTEQRTVKMKDGTEEKVEGTEAASKGKVYSPEERAELVRKLGLETKPEAKPGKKSEPKTDQKIGPKGKEVLEKTKAKAEPKKAEPKKAEAEPVTRKGNEPTEAQKEAGNYPKEHVRVHGLEVSLENKKGSTRSGKSPDGKEWSVKMPADYGYIRRTEGADGDHVDVYLGPDHDNPRVTIIDQVDPNTRKFDEHKVMMGFRSRDEALKTYDAGFSDGRGMERVGNVRSMSIAEFKDWLKNGDTTKPIAKAKIDALEDNSHVTETPAFRRWFGDSKVTDADGKPRVVYHGTTEDFSAFSKNRRGEATDAPSAREGFFFSTDPEVAESYAAGHNAYQDTKIGRFLQWATGGRYQTANEALMNLFGFSAIKSGENIKPVYLSIKNPLVHDFKGNSYREISFKALIDKAKAEGHDGVLFKNAEDQGFRDDVGGQPSDIYVAFEPEQIKSATGNRGTFDPNNPHIDALEGEKALVPPKVAPVHTTKLHDVLRQLSAGDVTTIGGKMAVFMRKRLLEYAPNVDLHFLTQEDMKALAGGRSASQNGPMGIHMRDTADNTVYVGVRADVASDPKALAHVVLHEATHAATIKAMEANPEFRLIVERMMDEVERQVLRRFDGNMPREAAYALKNAHEFIAEAFSNPHFQEILAAIPADMETARAVGLGGKSKLNAWTLFVASVRHMLRKVLGGPKEAYSMLEAIVKTGEHIMDAQRPTDRVFGREFTREVTARHRANEGLVDQLIDYGDLRDRGMAVASDKKLNLETALRAAGDWASTMWMAADRARSVSPEFGRLAEMVVAAKAVLEEAKTQILKRSGDLKLVNELAALKRNNPAEYERVADIGIEASNLNLRLGKDADNSHLGKDAMSGWQAKAKLPELQRQFDALSPEAQDLLRRTAEYYRDTHNRMSMSLIKNILKHAGIEEPGLAERIFKDGVTDADRAKFKTGSIITHLERAAELKEMKGWYVPFRRYGEHIVSGEHELTTPAGALKVGKDTIQFTDPSDTKARRAAERFVSTHDLRHVGTKKIWVDKNDHTKVLEASDTDAIPAYRVRMQIQHTEFHETPAAARAAYSRLEGEGLKNLHEATARDESVRNSSLMSGEMKTIVESLVQQPRFREMSATEQAAVKQALMEASVRVMGSTKIQSSFIQRRNVGGMSHDLTRVTADYSRTASGYLARLQHQPDVDAAFKALHEHVEANKFSSNKKRMDELVNTLTRQFKEDEVYRPQTTRAKVTRRLLQISRLDKLASPAFHTINSAEPLTTAMPVIGGRHGFRHATKALLEAYNIIGARGAVMGGLRDTIRARTQDTGFTDYVGMFKKEIANSKTLGGDKARRLQEMLDFNAKRGIFSDEAIFEVGRYADPTGNILARGLDRADLMANQMGSAIEGINRAVSAIAAYELEFKRTGSHEAAMEYSHRIVRDTMGDYSTWNQPQIFKSEFGQLALQFKKFSHKMYYLLGKTFRGTLARDPESAKQFAGLMVTHMVVAGALGLPLEPIKMALMAANIFGITPYTWNDFEHAARTLAVSMLGVKGGEVFSHGLTRLVGIDTSTRMGLDSLLTFGAPRSEKPQDIKAWLWDTAAGAPIGYLLDQVKTSQSLMKGDFAKAAETFVPIKVIADTVKAGAGMSPQTSSSNHETLRAFSPFEAAAQAWGFTPAVKVENYEKKAYAAGVMERDKRRRSELTNAWIAASAIDKRKIWQQVQEFNAGRPQAERLTMSQLMQAANRFRKGMKDYEGGMRFTKRDRRLRESLGIYNVE